MADVFISYSRENQAPVRALAEAVKREGYCVWWDDELPPHRSYGDVITEQIGAAKAAIVVWSRGAAASEWVRAEADVARNQKKLIQTSLDGHMPPMPFNQIQFANIGDWKGEADHPGWRKVQESLAALCGSPALAYPMPATPPPAPPAPPHKWHRLLIAVIATAFLAIAAVSVLGWMGGGEPAPVAKKAAAPAPRAIVPEKRPEAPPPVQQPAPVPPAPRQAPGKAAPPPRQAMPSRATIRYCMGRGRATAQCAALRRQYRGN
jgi:hypothetical protein